MAGEHVTTQHKPVVFVVRMQKKKQTKTVGRMTIKWWRCKDGVAVEYKERVTVKYEELSEEVECVLVLSRVLVVSNDCVLLYVIMDVKHN